MSRSRIFGFVLYLFVLPLSAFGAQRAFDGSQFDVLRGRQPMGARIAVRGVPIAGLIETLELQRFEVYAPDAKVRVQTPNGERIEAMPDLAFYRGRVAGRPDSVAFVSVGEEISGMVVVGNERYLLETQRNAAGEYFLLTPSAELQVPEPYSCGFNSSAMPRPQLPRAMAPQGMLAPNALTQLNDSWTAKLAIETDSELRAKFASRNLMLTYIANLVGAASTIYQSELRTSLTVGTIFDYEGVTDPWVQTTAEPALLELGDYWATTAARSQANVPRSGVVMLSGKNNQTSIAWIGTMGTDDFLCSSAGCGTYQNHYIGSYAVCMALTGTVNTSNKNLSTFWDVYVFAHEVGHNFDSDHTHCTASSGFGRTFVDYCENFEASRGCYGGTKSVPAESGTIMSYCHLLSGGYNNIRLIFGTSGEASTAMPVPMLAHINSVAPGGSIGIINASTSVCGGSTGNAASYANGGAGVTYAWSIVNGTITSATNSSSVTYTAGAAGQVTLQVTVTNAKGTATHASATVDIAASGLTPTSNNVAAAGGTGSFNVTSSCSWTAVSNSPFISVTGGAAGNGNGTVQYSVSVNNGPARVGTITAAGQTFTINQAEGASTQQPDHDMNSDGKADVLWRNNSNGDNAVWFMNGTSISGGLFLPNASTSLSIVGVADFDGDGDSDILFRNTSTGANAMWLMNGASVQLGAVLATVPNSMQVAGVGDLNNDTFADIVWRNNSTGEQAVWFMQGTTVALGAYLPTVAPPMNIAAVDDFNNDGRADIVFRNPTGTMAIWLMNGFTVTVGAFLPTVNNGLEVAGSGDLDGDGNADLIWRNPSTGDGAVWLMNGTAVSSGAFLPNVSTTLSIVGVGDVSGDNKHDILWRNLSNGQNAVWIMNGGSVTTGAFLPDASTSLAMASPK